MTLSRIDYASVHAAAGSPGFYQGQAVATPAGTRNLKGLGAATIVAGLLALAVFASALVVVYAKHENRRLFVELQGLQTTRDEMNVEWGQLQLEQSTLATHARIDAAARTQLEMIAPAPDTVVIVRP